MQSARLWPRFGMAFLAGGLATLALPPLYVFPAFFVSFPLLFLLLVAAKTKTQAFLTGWGFGFGYFVFGLYWVSFALFVDIAAWWWALPFAVVGLPFLLAFFSGGAGLIFRALNVRGLGALGAFTAVWCFAEFLRGHVFTGFPWNLPGYVWTGYAPMRQGAAFVGIDGLSLATVFLATLPAVFFMPEIKRPVAIRTLGLGLLFLAAWLCLGQARLWQAGDAVEPSVNASAVNVRIVQPNIPQTMKWDPDLQADNFLKLLRLSGEGKGGVRPPAMIVWPETAVGFDLAQDVRTRGLMGKTLPAGGVLLTGALRFGEGQFFNSIAAVGATGAITGWYDKFHLVPFGEYIPFRNVIAIAPFAAQVADISDFTPGAGPHTVHIEGLPPFSPLICYEVIFSGKVADETTRPGFLLNVTNDGWYGHTAGPHQHFAIARMRAVEEGLPLIRAANTGISAVIDPYGRVVASLPLGAEGAIDAALPESISAPPYTKAGSALYLVLSLFMLLWAAYDRRQ